VHLLVHKYDRFFSPLEYTYSISIKGTEIPTEHRRALNRETKGKWWV